MSENAELKVLLIEDNPGDAFLIKFYLEESTGTNYVLTHAEELATAKEFLSNDKYDILLLDLNLPDSFGVETIKHLLDEFPGNLVIVLTGLTDESIGIQAVQMGAQDFLVKGRFDGKVLNSSIRYAFERFQLTLQLKNYKEELEMMRHRFQFFQDQHGQFYMEFASDPEFLYMSRGLCNAVGIEYKGHESNLDAFAEKAGDASLNSIRDIAKAGGKGAVEFSIDGAKFNIDSRCCTVRYRRFCTFCRYRESTVKTSLNF